MLAERDSCKLHWLFFPNFHRFFIIQVNFRAQIHCDAAIGWVELANGFNRIGIAKNDPNGS